MCRAIFAQRYTSKTCLSPGVEVRPPALTGNERRSTPPSLQSRKDVVRQRNTPARAAFGEGPRAVAFPTRSESVIQLQAPICRA